MKLNLKSNIKKNTFIALFFLYSISIFTSKFGINFFGGGLALISIFSFPEMKKYFIEENMEYEKNISSLFFSIFILGIIFQFFSLGGIKSSGIFFYRTYFLLILPFTIFFLSKHNILNSLFKIMELTLFVAILKSFYNFYSIYHLSYTASIRVISFFDIMRWGIVLVMGLLIILPKLDSKITKENLFSWLVFLAGIISLILNNSRGPWLSLILGIGFYLVIGKKFKATLLILLIGGLFSTCLYLYKPNTMKSFITRFNSIETTKSGGNGARIFMWKESLYFMKDSFKENKKLFFFGTGLDGHKMRRRKKIFENYIVNKESYKNLAPDIKIGVSFMDAHNCYLNRLIETGFIYTIIYYFSLLFAIFKVFKNYLITKNNYLLGVLSVILAYSFCGIFYGYPAPYETFTFMFILSLGFVKYWNLKE